MSPPGLRARARSWRRAMTGPAPRVAIVTGSESGIGRATAVALAERGCDIGITWYREHQPRVGAAAHHDRRHAASPGPPGTLPPGPGAASARSPRPQPPRLSRLAR